jgi:hypothetical protein
MTRSAPPGRRAALAVVVSLGSLALAALAAELFLRFQARGRAAAAATAAAQAQDVDRELSHAERLRPSSYPDVIYELKPGLDGLFLGQPLRTNAHGFRGGPVEREKPEGTVRVVGLGDSHMFGWGVAQDEAYMARLATLLDGAGGCRWEILNFAVPGYNTVMEVATFEHRALAFSPDLVILHFVGNDEALPHFLDPNAASPAPRSHLWALLRGRLRGPEGEIGDDEADEAADDGDATEEMPAGRRRRRDQRPGQVAARGRYAHMAGERPFAAAMDRLGRLTRERSIPVLVVSLGHAKRTALQTAITRNGFEFLELSGALLAHLRATGAAEDRATWTRTFRIPGDGHPNALSHRLYAEAIAEKILEEPSPCPSPASGRGDALDR